VFLTVTEKARTFEPGTNFVAWACAIARYKVLEAARADRRSGKMLSPAVIESLAAEAPVDPVAILQESHDGGLHVDVDRQVDGVILQRADHLESGPVAHVRKARVTMAAEVPLEDPPIRRAVEDGSPSLEFADTVGRLPRVQLGHAPVVHVLASAHGVGEVHSPAVAIVNVGQRRRCATLGHHGVRLA
jgi:hypothetical protein